MSTDTRITPTPTRTGLDGFFKITERGSTVAREVRGGVVTFFTMVYIVVLNPIILSGVVDGSGSMIGGTNDLVRSKLLVAVGTAVVAGVMSILMGLVANFPIALAAGLGINGLFTAYIGVIDAGFARRPTTPGSVPSELGIGGSLDGWPTLVFVVGVFLIAVLLIRKVKGAILLGIVG